MSWLDVKPEDLRKLGFDSYRDYLTSDRWRDIRVKVLERDDWTCHYCGERADQVRHLAHTPDVLRGFDLGKLEPICSRCHLEA